MLFVMVISFRAHKVKVKKKKKKKNFIKPKKEYIIYIDKMSLKKEKKPIRKS